jgi:hypothetical protein
MHNGIGVTPNSTPEQQEFALHYLAASLGTIIGVGKTDKKRRVRAFHRWLCLTLRRKTFFTTEHSFVRIAPKSAAVGDLILLFLGMKTPFLVRRIRNGSFRLVAPACVQDSMNGELWDDKARLEEFVLV